MILTVLMNSVKTSYSHSMELFALQRQDIHECNKVSFKPPDMVRTPDVLCVTFDCSGWSRPTSNMERCLNTDLRGKNNS